MACGDIFRKRTKDGPWIHWHAGVRAGHYGSDGAEMPLLPVQGRMSMLPVQVRGRRVRHRMKYIATALLVSLLLAGWSLLPGGTTGGPAPNLQLLTWAPPQCGDAHHACVTLYLQNTGVHQIPVLDNNTDYRIYLPRNGPLVGGITIAGGRRVVIIGGEIDLTYPCSNDASDCTGIYIAKNSPGAVFVEGVWIHNPHRVGRTCPGGASPAAQTCSTGHGIDINTADNGVINVNTITLENIRIDGISGCSGYHDHADVFQPYQAPDDTIRIDRMTGVTNCQGFILDPDLAYTVWHRYSSFTIQDTNIDITPNPYQTTGIAWWLTYKFTCRSAPLTLTNDYSGVPPDGSATDAIWPDPAHRTCGGQYSRGGARWTGITGITGSIHTGTPPGGDFVPVGTAGLGYLTPGYQQ